MVIPYIPLCDVLNPFFCLNKFILCFSLVTELEGKRLKFLRNTRMTLSIMSLTFVNQKLCKKIKAVEASVFNILYVIIYYAYMNSLKVIAHIIILKFIAWRIPNYLETRIPGTRSVCFSVVTVNDEYRKPESKIKRRG